MEYMLYVGLKMTELCLKFALQLKDPNGAWNLVMYYLHEMEPRWSTAVLKTGREMGQVGLRTWLDKKFESRLEETAAKRREKETEVEAFQRKMKLPIKGWTFLRRLKRKESMESSELKKCVHRLNEIYQNVRWTDFADRSGSLNMNVISNGKYQKTIIFKNVMMTATTTEERVAIAIVSAEQMKHSLKANNLSGSTGIHWMDQLYEVFASEGYEIFMALLSQGEVRKLKGIVENLYKEKCGVRGHEDMKIRYCYAQLCMYLNTIMSLDNDYIFDILNEGVQRYPDNVHYYYLLMVLNSNKPGYGLSLYYTEEGLKVCPNHVLLLNSRASSLRANLHINKSEDINEFFAALDAQQKFLKEVPDDHDKRPQACYEMAEVYVQLFWFMSRKTRRVSTETLQKVREAYDLGIAAEKMQLECYLPYAMSVPKRCVERFFEAMKYIDGDYMRNDILKSEGILDRKPYLRSPAREGFVKQHRECLSQNFAIHDFADLTEKIKSKLAQSSPINMKTVESITLLEMSPVQDNIYQNKIIKLLIIEEPLQGFPLIGLLAEDQNGDLTQVFIYNANVSMANFEPGRRIAIVNPNMSVSAEWIGIRVDELKCLIFRGQVKSMCRFCGEKKAPQKCSKCSRPYCSRECQKLDWKMFDHKQICKSS